MGHSCEVSCKKEEYLEIAANENDIDCDYPFDYEDFKVSTGREFIKFMIDSVFIR